MKGLTRFLIPGTSARSPKGLFVRALILIVLFLLCHLAGLRVYTSVLTGTFIPIAGSTQLASLFGILYALLFLAAVLVAPILLIASGLLYLLERYGTRLS